MGDKKPYHRYSERWLTCLPPRATRHGAARLTCNLRRDTPLNFRRTIARATVGLVLGATVLSGIPTVAFADTSAELQSKLDQANSHLSSLYDEASRVSEEVNKTQEDLDATNAEIEQKTTELAQAQDILSRRVASNYKTGGVSLVSILFDSTSFEDMVNRITYASKVSDSDAQIIQQVKDIQTELDQKRAEQQQLLDDLKAQQAELDAKVAEAQSYVNSLDQQVQDALEAERAAAAAAAEAAQKEAERAAENNGGNYVPNTGNQNTNNNSNNTNNGGSNSGSGSVSGSLSASQRNAIVSAAWSKVGCSYVYGATGPSAYDCSGFVQYCYAQAGISLPRTSYAQGGCGTTTSNPQAGDIVCWGGHVGIYIGGGMMIDAGNPSVGVSYRAVYGSPWYQTL